MSKPKKSEIRLVAALLEKDHQTATDAAEAVLEALAEHREGEELWAGVASFPLTAEPGGGILRKGRGPFSTKHQAVTDVANLAAPGPMSGSFFVVKLTKGAE